MTDSWQTSPQPEPPPPLPPVASTLGTLGTPKGMWLREPGCGAGRAHHSEWLWSCPPRASLAPSLWLGVGIR